MGTRNYLYKTSIPINDKIEILVPTVGQVLDQEDNYYSVVTILTAMPIDFMVQLDDMGIDFTKIDEYELFILLSSVLKTMDTSLVFGTLDLNAFEVAVNEENNNLILLDKEQDIIIDRSIHAQIGAVLRKIHHLKKDVRKPGNSEAQTYMIERARKKMLRNRNRSFDSQTEELIIAMVNTEQYKYSFEGTRELSIYQFNESVRQVIKKVEYDHRMSGVYAGTIRVKDLSQGDLNWLTHK